MYSGERRSFASATSEYPPPSFMQEHKLVHHPISAASCATHVLGIPLTEDAQRTVLDVGLHHSFRLHQGGCNPIPYGRAAVQPVKRKRALLCALTRSHPLLPFLPSPPSFPPHLFTPCSVRLVGGAHPSGIVALFINRPNPGEVGTTRRSYLFFFNSLTVFFPPQLPFPWESTPCTPDR